jgi:hypothetical protein
MSSSPLLTKLFPVALGCGGSCKFKFFNGQYIPDGQNCGGDCHCPNPPGSLRKLLKLEGYLAQLDELTLPCCAFNCNHLQPAIDMYIVLLIKYKLMSKCAIGLGILAVTLLGALAYFLMR